MADPATRTLGDDGFVVLPGVLTMGEVQRIRSQVNAVLDEKGIKKHGSATLPNAAAEAQSLSWLFSHPEILRQVRLHTGLDELTFTAEADLHRNFLLGIWHKDTGEASMENGYFDCDPSVCDDCRVYKIALYLQDHQDGTGLTVRPGSTGTMRLDFGEPYGVPVHAGDAILFDVRLTHRGMLPTLADRVITRVGDALPHRFDPVTSRARRWKYHLSGRPERLAVYFAFGAPNAKSETFARRNMRRQLGQIGTKSYSLPQELTDAFQRANVRIAEVNETALEAN